MAERALDANGAEPTVGAAKSFHPDDRIGIEEGERDGRVIEVEAAVADGLEDACR